MVKNISFDEHSWSLFGSLSSSRETSKPDMRGMPSFDIDSIFLAMAVESALDRATQKYSSPLTVDPVEYDLNFLREVIDGQ